MGILIVAASNPVRFRIRIRFDRWKFRSNQPLGLPSKEVLPKSATMTTGAEVSSAPAVTLKSSGVILPNLTGILSWAIREIGSMRAKHAAKAESRFRRCIGLG